MVFDGVAACVILSEAKDLLFVNRLRPVPLTEILRYAQNDSLRRAHGVQTGIRIHDRTFGQTQQGSEGRNEVPSPTGRGLG